MRSTIFASLALSLAAASQVAAELPVDTLFQFKANDSWFENIATRSNGVILATYIGPPALLYAFDPREAHPKPQILHNFTSYDEGMSGIAEGAHDVFYVTGSNTTGSDIADPPANSTHLWEVKFPSEENNDVEVTLISHVVSPLTYYNGLAAYNETIILASASSQDSVYANNVETGDYWQAVEDDLMTDINGIKFQDGYLYWTSRQGLCRGTMHPNLTLSDTLVIYDGTFDDFAIAPDGFRLSTTVGHDTKYIYGATASDNTIQQISFNKWTGGDNKTEIIAGNLNSVEVAEPTGCFFGRGSGQLNKLYCTTGGGSGVAVDVNGTETVVGAQLLGIQLS